LVHVLKIFLTSLFQIDSPVSLHFKNSKKFKKNPNGFMKYLIGTV